jgi:hypothetical protein
MLLRRTLFATALFAQSSRAMSASASVNAGSIPKVSKSGEQHRVAPIGAKSGSSEDEWRQQLVGLLSMPLGIP